RRVRFALRETERDKTLLLVAHRLQYARGWRQRYVRELRALRDNRAGVFVAAPQAVEQRSSRVDLDEQFAGPVEHRDRLAVADQFKPGLAAFHRYAAEVLVRFCIRGRRQ